MSKITTIKCDRCGKIFDNYGSGHIEYAIAKAQYEENSIYFRKAENKLDNGKDLCPSCQTMLRYWFENPDVDFEIRRSMAPIPI